MCGVRRSRLPCDQFLPRFLAYSDFRAAAALTAAAVALNGSGYLCPGAQPFVKGNARNGVAQSSNRVLNPPQVLKSPEGVPVVIRNEDGRCIRAENWKQPGALAGERAPAADDLALCASYSERDDARLEAQIQELVRRLTPDDGWHAIRSFFLAKLRKVLTKSEHTDIDIFMFGSTVSGLATADSDADVYVRTGRGSMTVHGIAALLQRGGMEQIIVIDAAKVQIVKFQDTEFGIKCDINVDGKLALVNTRLVKSYVAIDWRVRAFIITVKHWAKRRGLNAAAEKTLSSYAWSCLCINHLQARSPPIVPSLHVLAQKRRTSTTLFHCTDTSAVSTDPDCRPRSPSPVSTASELDEGEEKEAEDFLSDLGDPELDFRAKNTESVAALLCSFFQTMAYEFDYHNTVVSVRQGTQIPKTEKGWNVGGCNVGRGRPYRVLAIEDPINIRRNLANSADETAVAGLRCEFRRAWKVLCQTGSLAEVCKPWRGQSAEPRGQEHASWSPRFSQEEVLADVEDFRRTQPAPRSISSLSDRSTCSSGSESRRSSICEEPTPPTSAACSSPATYHGQDKAVGEEEMNRPVPGISAIEPTTLPVEKANSMAAEPQIAVAGEVGVSQPVGHVAQTPGPVAETHPTGFVAEERAETPGSFQRPRNATTSRPPALPLTRTINDSGKSRFCNLERRPNGQPSPLAHEYEHEWPTLAEAGSRPRRNRRCQRMALSAPANPAPCNANSVCNAVIKSQSTVPAAPEGTPAGAPKKTLLGIGRGMPFPPIKRTPTPQPASRIPGRQQLQGPARAPSAETAKPERLPKTRCPSPAWAKLATLEPAPSGQRASDWPTLAASRGGCKKNRRS